MTYTLEKDVKSQAIRPSILFLCRREIVTQEKFTWTYLYPPQTVFLFIIFLFFYLKSVNCIAMWHLIEEYSVQSSSSSSSSDFWLTCRYRGHIHNSGPPSRQLACCTHGRSHTRSPVVSIMRVDSWELPLSAIPLCQLLPSHLGPPRPTLSINLYVKGCLHCTVGGFHVSISAESSLFQHEVQVVNAEPCK